jgi:hypothetical protein
LIAVEPEGNTPYQPILLTKKGHNNMEYRMAATIAIWLGISLMVLRGNLRGRDLAYALSAATISTIAVWMGNITKRISYPL